MENIKTKVDNIKTKEDEAKTKVDEYVKWENLLNEAKKEIEKLKADFQKRGLELMENKKVKQVEFWGSENSKVVVTVTETLKLVSYNFLLKVIGETLLKDFVKEEVQYKLTEPFKRLLIAVFQGTYIDQPVWEIIDQLTDDEKIRATLKKKLKGNWAKDMKSLQIIAGLSREDAEHYAYFIAEARNYEKIIHLLRAAGYESDHDVIQDALENLCHAVVVEEGVKVGVENDGAA